MGKPKKRKKPLHIGRDMRVSSADLPPHAEPVDVLIEAPDSDAKVLATKTLRDAPLDRLFVRKQISQTQYEAGCKARELFELFGSDGVRAMNFEKPLVDSSGCSALGITDAQLRAATRLKVARGILGQEGFNLICEVLGRRKFIETIARERGVDSQREKDFLARRFRECLDSLAVLFGLMVSGVERRPVRDAFSKLAQSATNPELHRSLTAARDAERLNDAAEAALKSVRQHATKLSLPKGRAA